MAVTYPSSLAPLQVYNLTIRQFGALQSIAPNMHQMGYRWVTVASWQVRKIFDVFDLKHGGRAGRASTTWHTNPCLTSTTTRKHRDKAWSVNRLGCIARLHHQPEACVQIINTLYGFNAMEVQEAFVKVSRCAAGGARVPRRELKSRPAGGQGSGNQCGRLIVASVLATCFAHRSASRPRPSCRSRRTTCRA